MSWQEPVALVIVALTALIFLWQRFGSGKQKLKHDCGCGAGGGQAKQRLIYRARKGERPQVVVKME